jgi:hypothetical protein
MLPVHSRKQISSFIFLCMKQTSHLHTSLATCAVHSHMHSCTHTPIHMQTQTYTEYEPMLAGWLIISMVAHRSSSAKLVNHVCIPSACLLSSVCIAVHARSLQPTKLQPTCKAPVSPQGFHQHTVATIIVVQSAVHSESTTRC